jgi:hypothetical protein
MTRPGRVPATCSRTGPPRTPGVCQSYGHNAGIVDDLATPAYILIVIPVGRARRAVDDGCTRLLSGCDEICSSKHEKSNFLCHQTAIPAKATRCPHCTAQLT